MSDTSDSDSSPKKASSSGGDAENPPGAPRTPLAIPDADPGSPSNAQQPSDDSGSSDGVLVELPGNPDQDSRGSPNDPDSGILVNIDGTTQEAREEEGGREDDSGREEAFEDAEDQLARSLRLEESMAVIDIGESSQGRLEDELARVRARLEDTAAECWKYKEEREVFGREVVDLRRQLQDIVSRQSLLATIDDDPVGHLHQSESRADDKGNLMSPTPLHSMLDDCSDYVQRLQSMVDAQASSEGVIRELNPVLYTKEQEIEDLRAKALESSLSRDVFMSYLDSIQMTCLESVRERSDLASKRMLASLETVFGQDHGSPENDDINEASLVERKTLLLIENHRQFLMEAEKLAECLVEVRPDFMASEPSRQLEVLGFAREALLRNKRKEADFLHRMNTLEEENRALAEQVGKLKDSLDTANVETGKVKSELEQTESKLLTAKEKLSMAVAKGKSLVQNRDLVKQSLTEKTNELERCMVELQQKSDAVQATEAIVEEQKMLLAEKSSELQKCLDELQQKSDALEIAKAGASELNETRAQLISLQNELLLKDKVLQDIDNVISEKNFPPELLPLEAVDKVRWFVDQKISADAILTEHKKLKDSICSLELPETILSCELESQINWLVGSLGQSRSDMVRIREEHKSKMSNVRGQIDHLTMSLLKEKQEKDILQNEHAELMSQYEVIAEKLSVVSSDKDELMKALLKVSEVTMDGDAPMEINSMIERCVDKLRQGTKSFEIEQEQFETLQSLLYVRDQELILCKNMLEEYMVDRSERMRLSDELQSLRNDKDSLQKELERVEEKSSLLREKLSMAVKKGKGLVQEREGFRQALDEKNSEIEKLKQDLQSKDSSIIDFQEHVQKLESEFVSLLAQKEQTEKMLDQSKNSWQTLVISIESIIIPTDDLFDGPVEKLNWIARHIQEAEVSRVDLEKELQKLKEDSTMLGSGLSDASLTIKSLENELSKAKEHLEKAREEASISAEKLTDAASTIKSLEDALFQVRSTASLLDAEKNEVEVERDKEIVALNTRLAECMVELERHSTEQLSHLGELNILLMDESLSTLMAEEFRKKINSFRNMGFVMQNMHEQFAAKGLHVDPNLEVSEPLKISSLPNHESFVKDRTINFKNRKTGFDEIPPLSMIIDELTGQAKSLGDYFKDLSSYTDDYILRLSQALQATSDEFSHILDLQESLETELMTISSLCNDATQEIQTAFSDLFDSNIDVEDIMDVSAIKDEDPGEYVKVANSLLAAARRLKVKSRQIANAKSDREASVNDLTLKLKQAELAVETASRDRRLCEERAAVLEKDFRAREDTWKAKEEKLLSIHYTLTSKDGGTTDLQNSEDQVKALVDKVKKLVIPFGEPHLSGEGHSLSTPIDKLLYIVDNVGELQHRVDSLACEKDDMQQTVASHVNEIEHLKKASESIDSTYQELLAKRSELAEITTALDRIIQRSGGKELAEDQKPVTAKSLLLLLERMTIASSMEFENSKSKLQELGAKLQTKEKVVDELSVKVKMLEGSYHARLIQPEISKETAVFESSSTAIGSEITEIEELGATAKLSTSSIPMVAHARTMRKGSNDHLVVDIAAGSERLTVSQENDDKGHVFKSLNTTGLIPTQGKFIADKVDSIWVSGVRVLKSRPRSRLGVIVYVLMLHLWVLGTTIL